MELSLDIENVVRELGGDPESDPAANLQLLANEIVIAREKLRLALEAEGRAERRAGKEAELRAAAERRVKAAEEALAGIEATIARAKRKAVEQGVPLRLEYEEVEAPESFRRMADEARA